MTVRRGFGALIRNARERQGWSQADLGERLNVSPSTISNLEREQHPPTVPDQVNALARALPLSTEALLAAMGVDLTPALAARLPRDLVRALLEMAPEELAALTILVQRRPRPAPPPAERAR